MIRVNYDEKTGKVIGFNKDTKPYIEITEAERKQPLPDKYSYYVVENGKFVIKQRTITDEEKARDVEFDRQKRLAEIDKWFKDNDWIINKLYLGEWKVTDTRWIEYLKKRAEIRAEHERLVNGD